MKQPTIKDVSPREELILTTLYSTSRYGYEITKAVLEASDGLIELKPGTIYPVLRDLEKKKLIEGRWGDEQEEHQGGRRRYYELTSEGVWLVRALFKFRQKLANGNNMEESES